MYIVSQTPKGLERAKYCLPSRALLVKRRGEGGGGGGGGGGGKFLKNKINKEGWGGGRGDDYSVL